MKSEKVAASAGKITNDVFCGTSLVHGAFGVVEQEIPLNTIKNVISAKVKRCINGLRLPFFEYCRLYRPFPINSMVLFLKSHKVTFFISK